MAAVVALQAGPGEEAGADSVRRRETVAQHTANAEAAVRGQPAQRSDAGERWPDERYVEAVRGSRVARVAGDGHRPPSLDRDKPEDRAFHDTIVRAVQERRDLVQAAACASGVERALFTDQLRFADDRIDRLVDQLHGLSRREVADIKKALGQLDQPDIWEADGVAAMSSDALWARLDGVDRGEAWSEALAELVEREDPALPAYIAAELHGERVSPETRRALVFAAERAQCFDARTRASLKEALLSHALVMRDTGEEKALWAAIRRYASMVPVDEAGALLQFLRAADAPATRQAALQAIQNIFAVEAPADVPAVRDLCAGVHALAEAVVAPACLGERGGPALALEAFCAAASLGDPGLPPLAPRLAALGRPYVLERAQEHLRSLDERWGRLGGDARMQRARAAVREALGQLTAPEDGEDRG